MPAGPVQSYAMGIFTHACLASADIDRSCRFYDAALAPLGIVNLGDFLAQGIGYGRSVPELLVLRPLEGQANASNGATLGFNAGDHQAVDAFHAAGLAHGGTDAGLPGPRGAVAHAYGAYLRDPDGNKICAYCFRPEPADQTISDAA